jgi:hypothetical protein
MLMDPVILVPTSAVEDGNLSLAAIGMLAYISYEKQTTLITKDEQFFLDRVYLKCGELEAKRAYKELVEEGYIDHILEGYICLSK